MKPTRFRAAIMGVVLSLLSSATHADQASDARDLERAFTYGHEVGLSQIEQTLRLDGCRAQLVKRATYVQSGDRRYIAGKHFVIGIFTIREASEAAGTDIMKQSIVLQGSPYDDPRAKADLAMLLPPFQAAIAAGERTAKSAMMSALYDRVIDGEFGQRLIDNHQYTRYFRNGGEEFEFNIVLYVPIDVDPSRKSDVLDMWRRYTSTYCPPS